jgi:hypothetical protein
MTAMTLTRKERLARWREAAWLLRHIDFEPLPDEARINAILQRLPERSPEEPFDAWLRRAGQIKAEGYSSVPSEQDRPQRSAVILPFKNPRFVPLTEFVRLAADSRTERYPLPDDYMESADGRFRLQVVKDGEELRLLVEAQGMTIDKFANTYVALSAGRRFDDIVAPVLLDNNGAGECRVPDTEDVRRALLRPIFGAVRDG